MGTRKGTRRVSKSKRLQKNVLLGTQRTRENEARKKRGEKQSFFPFCGIKQTKKEGEGKRERLFETVWLGTERGLRR